MTPPSTLRIPFVRRCTVRGVLGEGSATPEGGAMLLDLSLKGVYIATKELPDVGDALEIKFRVPGNDRELAIKSVVAWVQAVQTHPVHGLPPGFGATFKKLDVEDVRVLARAIQNYCLSNPLYRQYL